MIDASRLVLGTAQWGLPSYGVANATGMPGVAEVRSMLEAAASAGVRVLDTAQAYGASEQVIGRCVDADPRWQVVTKLHPDVNLDGTPDEIAAGVKARIRRSLSLLGVPKLDTLLLHRARHRWAADQAVWDALRRLRDNGLIDRLGVSTATPAEAMEALSDPEVQDMQVATSLLDQRLIRAGFFPAARQAGKRVFVRSVFLQGLTLMKPEDIGARLRSARPVLAALRAWAIERERRLDETLILYARQASGSHLVIGSETLEQLRQNLRAFTAPPLSEGEMGELTALVPDLGDDVLDPARW